MKNIFSLLALGLALASPLTALAGTEGAIGRASEQKEFVAAYIDARTHLAWSKALPLLYTNGCGLIDGMYDRSKCTTQVGPDGYPAVKVADSDAATACDDMGARLPTIFELFSLLKNFDHTEVQFFPYDLSGPRLTDKGIADLEAVFGDIDKKSFWTTSVAANYFFADSAYIYEGLYGLGYGSAHKVGRQVKNSVLCVSPR